MHGFVVTARVIEASRNSPKTNTEQCAKCTKKKKKNSNPNDTVVLFRTSFY